MEVGYLTKYQLKRVLRHSNLLTPKELNGVVRSVVDDQFKPEDFKESLMSVRYELAKSRILETNLDSV